MNKYSAIEFQSKLGFYHGWIGFRQTQVNWKNHCAIYWEFFKRWHFGFYLLDFRILGKYRAFISLNLQSMQHGFRMSFSVLFLPSLALRIGLWYFTCENFCSWKIRRKSVKDGLHF